MKCAEELNTNISKSAWAVFYHYCCRIVIIIKFEKTQHYIMQVELNPRESVLRGPWWCHHDFFNGWWDNWHRRPPKLIRGAICREILGGGTRDIFGMNCPKNAPFGTFLRHLGHRDIVGVKSPFYNTGMLGISHFRHSCSKFWGGPPRNNSAPEVDT